MVLNKSLKIFKKNHSRNIYFMINVGNILLLIYSAVCDYKKLRQTKYNRQNNCGKVSKTSCCQTPCAYKTLTGLLQLMAGIFGNVI